MCVLEKQEVKRVKESGHHRWGSHHGFILGPSELWRCRIDGGQDRTALSYSRPVGLSQWTLKASPSPDGFSFPHSGLFCVSAFYSIENWLKIKWLLPDLLAPNQSSLHPHTLGGAVQMLWQRVVMLAAYRSPPSSSPLSSTSPSLFSFSNFLVCEWPPSSVFVVISEEKE